MKPLETAPDRLRQTRGRYLAVAAVGLIVFGLLLVRSFRGGKDGRPTRPPPAPAAKPPPVFVLGGNIPPDGVAKNRSVPRQNVTVSPFTMDETEVSSAAYAGFLNAWWKAGRIRVELADNGVVVRAALKEGAGPPLCWIDEEGQETHLTWNPADPTTPFGVWTRGETRFDDHPAVSVTWFGAALFCNWRSESEGLQPLYPADFQSHGVLDLRGSGYRLPTEAEWEQAACWDPVTGRKTLFAYGDTWDPRKANVLDSREEAMPPYPATEAVSSHGAGNPATDGRSPRGLLNMTGNVWEWCHDWYADYPKETDRDPVGPATGTIKVVRGGSFRSERELSWCDFRGILEPASSLPDLGFRTVRASR